MTSSAHSTHAHTAPAPTVPVIAAPLVSRSVGMPASRLVDRHTNVFLPAEALRPWFADVLNADDHPNVALYEGSLIEWQHRGAFGAAQEGRAQRTRW